jgi:uncharacterized protein YjbI with pentapeptide repeats
MGTENGIWLPPLSPKDQKKVDELDKKQAKTNHKWDWGFSGKNGWDWIQFFAVLAIPIIVAAGTLYLTQQITFQQTQLSLTASEKQHQTDLQIAQDQQREADLQGYLDRMSDLLLNSHLRESHPEDEVSTVARARTLTVLQRLDPGRKTTVVQFLYEAQLIIGKSPVISLTHADLSNMTLGYILPPSFKVIPPLPSIRTPDLHGVNLSGANLSGADLYADNLSNADLSFANLNSATLADANLSNADLSDTDLSNTDLSYANLSHARLKAADLYHVNMSYTDLSRAELNNANLVDDFMNQTILFGADLSGATLLVGGNALNGTNLNNVNLSNAKLFGDDLRNAQLNGANLSNTDLSNANLKGALVSSKQLAQAKSLRGTIMPDGSIHP